MTTSTIAGVSAQTAAATDAVEALASAAVARLHDSDGHGADGMAFGRVLADERGASEPYAAPDADRDAVAPRQSGPRDRTGAASSQPESVRHDDPAAGRAREDVDRASADRTAAARGVGTTATGANDDTTTATTADGSGTGDGTAGAASDPTSHSDGAGATTGTGTTDATGTEEDAGSGKGTHKRLAAADATVPAEAPSAAAIVNPAVTSVAGATPLAAGDAERQAVRAATDTAPAVAAAPGAPGSVAAAPATQDRRPPEAMATPAAADPTRIVAAGAPGSSPVASNTNPTTSAAAHGSPASTAAAGDAVASALAQSVPPASADDGPVAIAPSGAPSAVAADAPASAPDVARIVSALPVTPPAAGARRDGRGRSAAAAADASPTKGGDSTTTTGTASTSPSADSDVARARASIARITAARAGDAADEHRPDAVAKPNAAAPSTAPATQAGPSADAALAAIAAARASGTPSAGPSAQPVSTSATTALAADRVAFEAIDRITTTVKAGVPGLESRIDDPELGTIRIVVSARLGETIRAEIVARDPAAARELASGIDRALAAGATLPGNMDLRVRAEGAAPAARADAHLGPGSGGQSGPWDQPSSGAFTDAGGHAPGRDADGGVVTPAPAPMPDRGRGLGPVPVAVPLSPGSAHSRTALDVRA